MKQDRNVPQTRGYRLTPKAVRAIQEERTPLYQLTPKGIAFVQDCNAKLGAIAEDENLPRPTTEKSHVDLVNEEIDLMEQELANKELSKGDKLAILMNCSDRLHKRWLAAWEEHQALPIYDVRLNAAFAKLQRITKASSRLTKKIADMLDES